MSILGDSGTGGSGSSYYVEDWGDQGGVGPVSDGTPGYRISRGPTYSSETVEGDYGFSSNTGWNIINGWMMDYGYLASLPISTSGDVIGSIYQDVYSIAMTSDDIDYLPDGVNPTDYLYDDSDAHYGGTDQVDIHCRIYTSQVHGTTNRLYSYYNPFTGQITPQDIFQIADADMDANGYVLWMQWGESYFVAAGDSEPSGGAILRMMIVAAC